MSLCSDCYVCSCSFTRHGPLLLLDRSNQSPRPPGGFQVPLHGERGVCKPAPLGLSVRGKGEGSVRLMCNRVGKPIACGRPIGSLGGDSRERQAKQSEWTGRKPNSGEGRRSGRNTSDVQMSKGKRSQVGNCNLMACQSWNSHHTLADWTEQSGRFRY